MPKTQLYYFPIKGLGEGIRLLLAYGGEEFEDIRIPHEEWPEQKKKMKFGQVPVLVIDGKQHAQNVPIARYLGHKYGLAGATLEENFEIDQNIEFFNDIRVKLLGIVHEEDPAAKQKKQDDFINNFLPGALSKLHEIIVSNNGHLAAGKLTYADFIFAGYFDAMRYFFKVPDFDTKYPYFKKVADSVYGLPKVKEWAAKAPRSEY